MDWLLKVAKWLFVLFIVCPAVVLGFVFMQGVVNGFFSEDNTNGPSYVLKDERGYGYEATDNQVVFVQFLGDYDGSIQFLNDENKYAPVIFVSPPPYDYLHEASYYDGEPINRNTYKMDSDRLFYRVIQDARNGHLQRYVKGEGDAARYYKVNEDMTIEAIYLNATTP